MRSPARDLRNAGAHAFTWLSVFMACRYTVWPSPRPAVGAIAGAVFVGVALGTLLVRLFPPEQAPWRRRLQASSAGCANRFDNRDSTLARPVCHRRS